MVYVMFKLLKIQNCDMAESESIVALLLAGECNQEIVEELKVSIKTFYNVKKHLEYGECFVHKSWAGIPKTMSTPRLTNDIKSRVARNPVRSRRGMARDLKKLKEQSGW